MLCSTGGRDVTWCTGKAGLHLLERGSGDE